MQEPGLARSLSAAEQHGAGRMSARRRSLLSVFGACPLAGLASAPSSCSVWHRACVQRAAAPLDDIERMSTCRPSRSCRCATPPPTWPSSRAPAPSWSRTSARRRRLASRASASGRWPAPRWARLRVRAGGPAAAARAGPVITRVLRAAAARLQGVGRATAPMSAGQCWTLRIAGRSRRARPCGPKTAGRA
jgi:hypothetical protein